jgi:DNA-binding CsgD family transcriptional regulator
VSAANVEQVSLLIGDIYDAALDPALWRPALEKITRFVGGPASALVSHNTVSRTGRFYYSWGDDPHYTKLYLEKYVRLNPAAPHLMLVGAGEVRSISDVVPFDEFRKSRLYLEWAKPQGYGDATTAVIEKSAMSVAHLTTVHFDRDGPADDGVRRRMQLIVPHVRRAVAIAEIIDLHRVDADTLADAVDALAAGVFLVREDAQIARANASGRAMLATRDILREAENTLVAIEPHTRRALHDAIADALGGDVTLGSRGIAVPLVSRNDDRYVAHVLPLTAGARRQAGLSHAAVAAVFVHKSALDRPLPLATIAEHFRLTPAEVRVLFAIVEVGGVPEAAPMLGISQATVKTHLKHLFQKTGARRQSDLVKLVASFLDPLVG